MQKITRVSGLLPIDEEAFIHNQIEHEFKDADFDYDGGFGEDEDISDLTAAQTIGCHSILVTDHYCLEETPDAWDVLVANDDAIFLDDYDAKDLAA